MLEDFLTFSVRRNYLPATVKLVFIGKQSFQAYWPTGVQLAVANAYFGAQAVAKAIGKASGSVMEDARGIHFIQKLLRRGGIFRNDAFGVP